MNGVQTDHIDKMIARRFTSSSLSDSKWRKLFSLLADADLGVTACDWKFVDEDRVFRTHLPAAEDLASAHLVDGRFQPFVYRDIEWIEMDAPDVMLLMERLQRVGNFDVCLTSGGLRIYGYR